MTKQEGEVVDGEAAAETTETKEPAAPKRGVGTVACEAIMAGKTNEQALEAVKAEFPDAKTTMASINWYRNDLRSKDFDVPTARDLKAGARAETKAAKAAEKEAAKAAKKAERDAEKARKAAAKKQTTTDSASAIAAAEGGEVATADEGFLA